MPVQFFEQNSGLGELARALTGAPALFAQGRRQGQQQALARANDAAGIRKSIADARKTELETESLADQRGFRAGLPQDLDVLDARRSGRNLPVAPPAVGSASSPLEFDINQSLRGNEDLFASRDVPSATQSAEALANVLRGFGGNAQQITGALGNVQGQDLTAEAAGAARGGDNELAAVLNSIASGSTVPAVFDTNASGTVLNRFSGGLDESGQLAGANIDAERALAEDRRDSMGTALEQNAVAAGFEPGTPEFQQFVRENVNQPLVSIGAEDMQTQQGKRLGEFLGDSFIEMQEQAREAAQQNAQLDRIEQLLDGVQTGRGMPTLTEIQGLASTFGVELGTDLGQKEAARSLANQIALRFRSPESGMGLPGATSDRDLAFLQSFPPGIGQSPEGRALITETFRRINTRKQQVAEAALELVQRNQAQGVNGLTFADVGTLQNVWAEPMFDDEFIQRAQGVEGGQSAPAQPGQGGGPADFAGQPPASEAAQPQTQEEFDQLPSGAVFIDPGDGKPYRKP